MLVLENVNAFYGRAQALFHIGMEAKSGEVVAILGRNGVGKTTLLKSIMGIEVSRTGRIEFDGKEIAGMKTHEIASLGVAYIPDYTGLIPGLTVVENLQLALGSREIDVNRALGVYPELKELLARKADTLSGGERKITAIVRAILMEAKLLLLDEPTEGVMPVMAKRIYRLLRDMHGKGITILLVEQGSRLSLARQIATRIAVMVNGRFVYQGAPESAEMEWGMLKKYLAL